MLMESNPPKATEGGHEEAPNNTVSNGKQPERGPKFALPELELNLIKALRGVAEVTEKIEAAKRAGRAPITVEDFAALWTEAFGRPVTGHEMAQWRLEMFDERPALPWADGQDETIKQHGAQYIADAHSAVMGAFTAAASLRKKLCYVFSRDDSSGSTDLRRRDFQASAEYLNEQFTQLNAAISGARHALSSVKGCFLSARFEIAAALKLDEVTVTVGGVSYACFHQAALCAAERFAEFSRLIDRTYVNVVSDYGDFAKLADLIANEAARLTHLDQNGPLPGNLEIEAAAALKALPETNGTDGQGGEFEETIIGVDEYDRVGAFTVERPSSATPRDESTLEPPWNTQTEVKHGAGGPEASALSAKDIAEIPSRSEAVVLEVLNKARGRLMTNEAIEKAAENRLGLRTIGTVTKKLVEVGLAKRPKGPKKGVVLTEAGQEKAQSACA